MNQPKDIQQSLVQNKASQANFKDNTLKAIIFINIFALSRSILSILFKYVNRNGVSLAEFMIWRNLGNLAFATLFL